MDRELSAIIFVDRNDSVIRWTDDEIYPHLQLAVGSASLERKDDSMIGAQ